MRARYIGNPKRGGEGPETVEFFGLAFPKGAWVDASSLAANDLAIRKLTAHPFFELDRKGKAAPASPPARPPAPEAPPPKESETAALPDDWRELHHMKRIALANSLGGSVTSAREADAFLEARAAAQPAAAEAPPARADDDDWGDLDPE